MRLVFARLGLESELRGDDLFVPGDQKLVIHNDAGGYQPKVEDGPWPAFPADLTSIALALATQSRGLGDHPREDVREPPVLHRQAAADGRRRSRSAIRTARSSSGPRRLRGERLESPDIRAGMAMLIAALCAEGTTEIGNIRQIDRGYERIDERLRALGARIERVEDGQRVHAL